VRQVVVNLIDNAVKFTQRGVIALRTTLDKDVVTVLVSDTGPGIPLEEQTAIFDEFRHGKRTAALGYGGLGLGLAICKRLVKLQGGQIGVRSSGKDGEGATVYFTIPRLQKPACLYEQQAVSCDQKVLLGVKKLGSEKPLHEYLSQRGFDVMVVEVDSFHDWAMPMMTSLPKAVVLDSEIADEEGWRILKLLRENPITKEVPVLFYALKDDRAGGSVLELDYLLKPLGLTELAQALERQGLGQSAEDRTVLIVDDELYVLEMYARMVEMWAPGVQVLQARSGRQAIDLIRQHQPHLVILDLIMPGMDGFEVLEMMRGEASSRDIPVIVLTGQVMTQETMARLNTRVTSVLQKELFSLPEMLAHIEAALNRDKNVGGTAQCLVRKAMALIHEGYEETISLESMADQLGVSKEHLARCFREETGVTLVTYLNRYRVERAKRLLREKEKRVVDVALEVGFSSGAYFSRVFKQEVGKSPQAYRQDC
jgi:DNA-binding response OmpR family regulator